MYSTILDSQLAISVFLGFLTIVLTRKLLSAWRNGGKLPLPPGPSGWPILGNIPLLFRYKNKQLELVNGIKERYGDVARLQNFSRSIILLATWETMKEAFITRKIINKSTESVGAKFNQNKGIVASNGALWSEHRQFTARWLKNLGAGKKVMENPIIVEIDELCASITALNGAVFDPRPLLGPSILNIIWMLVAGKRFLLDDAELARLLQNFNRFVQLNARLSVVSMLPWLRFLPIIGNQYWEIKSISDELMEFMQNTLDEKKKDVDEHTETTDLTLEYLKQMKRDRDKGNVNTTFTDFQIIRILSDFFAAGGETTVTTLSWALLILASKPDIQKRLQEEIDHVVGQSGIASTSHRPEMPFTEAVIAEVQRYASIVPVISHISPTESEIKGFRVPAGSTVMINLWSILRDPKLWKEPDEFNPDRFLNEEGKFSTPEYFVPFSAGPRVCLGETVAKMELFLFTVSFFQRFTFKLAPDEKAGYDPIDGVTMGPRTCNIIAIPR